MTSTDTATTNPAEWNTNADGSLACPHRDLSVCPSCATHPEVADVVGAHYHDPDGTIAADLAEVLAPR